MSAPRHFLTLADLGGRDALLAVLANAAELKRLRGTPEHPRPLAGKSVALIFEKSSTRTRVSFEVGVFELGAHPLVLFGRDLQIGRGEPLPDTARIFSGYVHALVWRTYGHDRLVEMAKHSRIPVVNALSDDHHPCQLLADLLTIQESLGTLEGKRVAWIGDGNNMAHSWIEAAAILGMHLVLACPPGYVPKPAIVAEAARLGPGTIEITQDVNAAFEGADVVTTDVWASMGQESEQAERARAFDGYLVSAERMRRAAPGAIFLHCLPAHRGEEVEAAVIDGPQSRVWDEAENRLHTQKALLSWLFA